MTDTEIVKRIKLDDDAAFAALYDSYWSRVYNFAKLYINTTNEIMDIVQETFIKIWESRHTLDEKQNLNGFLFITTRNLIFNQNRKHFNEVNFKMTILKSIENSYSIEESLEAENLKEYINELVALLPPRQREVFRMSREENLSYREISERCSITEKAVERHIHLALKFIKKNLPLFLLFMR